MLDSNNRITRVQLAIIIIWLSFTLAIFYAYLNKSLTDYDSSKKLTGMSNQEIASYLTPYLNIESTINTKTILHFSTPKCDCQKYSAEHIKNINNIASDNHFNIVNINIEKSSIIPSTPAIAILDEHNKIIYFGPYGKGLTCSETTGFALTVLNNAIHGYFADEVIKEAKGCYCAI